VRFVHRHDAPSVKLMTFGDRVGGPVARTLLSHHRTCESASGGSSGVPDQRVTFDEAAQAEVGPIGTTHGPLERARMRHPPRPLS
jgi:hypothetical protein